MSNSMSAVASEVIQPVRLDLGCGPNPKEGFHGVDSIKFDKVGTVANLAHYREAKNSIPGEPPIRIWTPWPWADNSVDEVHCSHFLEHLEGRERVHFANELYRVLKKGAKATIIAPHWSSCRAYGDMTHKWPPVSEFWFYYLSKDWRKTNCPHDDIEHNPNGYSCDFDGTGGYTLAPSVSVRNADYQNYAMSHLLEARQDIFYTLTKK